MGMFDNILNLLKINRENMTVLVVGLNNSGKSTIINSFKRKNANNSNISIPTVGFTNEEFYSNGVHFTVIDMSGAWKYRNLWQHQFKNCQGIIFVIDSCDNMRMVVKEELYILLKHPDLINRQIPILLYANKNDCTNSISSVNIASALDLTSVINKPWHICSCSAKTSDGLEEGVQWLIQEIRIKNQTYPLKKDKSKRK